MQVKEINMFNFRKVIKMSSSKRVGEGDEFLPVRDWQETKSMVKRMGEQMQAISRLFRN